MKAIEIPALLEITEMTINFAGLRPTLQKGAKQSATVRATGAIYNHNKMNAEPSKVAISFEADPGLAKAILALVEAAGFETLAREGMAVKDLAVEKDAGPGPVGPLSRMESFINEPRADVPGCLPDDVEPSA